MLLLAKLYCLPLGESNPIVLLALSFFLHSPFSLAYDGVLSSYRFQFQLYLDNLRITSLVRVSPLEL